MSTTSSTRKLRLDRDELAASIAARRELGPDHEDEIVDAFLDRVERELDERLARRRDTAPAPVPPTTVVTRHHHGGLWSTPYVLPIVSIALGIPVMEKIALLGHWAGLIAAIVFWTAVAVINWAYATRGRR